MQNSANFSGWTFGTTAGGSGWVIVDEDESLNNAGSATGGTTPMLLSEYSTTIVNAHQLQLMQLDPTASYTLANDIDASVTASGDVWSSAGFVPVGDFSGSFNGSGHTISGLTIEEPSVHAVGLFGLVDEGAVISDVTLADVHIVASGGGNDVGAVAGENDGTISDVTGAGAAAG